MANINYYQKALDLLKDLKKRYSTFNMGRHLSTVLTDYGDPWNVTDKELYFALEKYSTNLDLYDGVPISDEKEIEKILREGQDLDSILNEEDEEDY